MPKKQIRNAFYFFMLDWKAKQEKRGKHFPNGLKDVQADPKCSEEWTNMTKQQKGPYEKKAKDTKNQIRNIGKQTGTGESVDFLEAERRRKQEFHDNMAEYIKSTISMAMEQNALKSRDFYFIHVNYFYTKELEKNQVEYAPAEFAVARFSLEKGVQDTLHQLIYCKPPLGYTREAIEHSNNSHKIPCELPMGEKNFAAMYDKLENFLCASKDQEEGIPPLYTTNKCSDIIKSLLRRMAVAIGRPLDDILVYSLEMLFSNLCNICQKEDINLPLVMAEYELAKDVFAFTPGLECELHMNIDGYYQHCSLSIVKRWVFTICDYCCENLDIEMIPGAHCPLNISNSLSSMLCSSMSSLSIKHRTPTQVSLSTNGMSAEYHQRASERTVEEEKQCRREFKPVPFIDHSKLNENAKYTTAAKTDVKVGPLPTRNLRTPKTYASAGADLALDLSETNFPVIGGRGLAIRKKKNNELRCPFSVGHGSSEA